MAIDAKQGSTTYHGYPDYKGRQGETFPKTRAQRALFTAALVALFISAVVVSILR